MSTNSVIARQQGDGFVGRFAHWDGYPSHMVPELLRIVNDLHDGDGEAALKVLVDEHPGWSTVTANPSLHHGDGLRFVAVPGYGVAHTILQYQQAGMDPKNDAWISESDDPWGAEWAYALNGKGISVFERTYDPEAWEFKAFVRYDAEVPAELMAT